MAKCSYCKAETEMYEGGDVPICVECSDARKGNRSDQLGSTDRLGNILKRDLNEATLRASEASESFDRISSDIPSGRRNPDSKESILNASKVLTIARADMMKAH